MRFNITAIIVFIFSSSFGQSTVMLDNWYNREISPKTGQIFHYTWNDTLNSGFAILGSVFTEEGMTISTLESAPDSKNLSESDIYIIVDPDTTSENPSPNYIEKSDIKAIKSWVKKGGILLLMANDGPNCEFTHLNILSSQFGISFGKASLNKVVNNDWNMGAEVNLPDHPLFRGISKIYLKEVAPVYTGGKAKKVLTDGPDTFIAECTYGKGYVLAVGDPWLYNEYIDHRRLPSDFQNMEAAVNLAKLLKSKVK
jgi:hypothetical protein